MRKFKMGAGTLALLTAMVAALFVPSAIAMVWTDKEDYSPGETVTISGDNSDGAGYLAGETVHVDVSGPFGYTASCDGLADDNGAWSCQVTLRDDESAEGDYSYTATGQTSGVSQSGTFTDQGGGSPANCVTAGGFPPLPFTVSDQGFRDSNAAVGDMRVDLDAHNDAPGDVITKICVRSFGSSFALGGSGGDANSQAGGSAPGTSPHSIPITADGSGGDPTRYGIDNEPGDTQNGCYTVSGIGTRAVSVTRAPTVDGAPNCMDVQHLDIFTEPRRGESTLSTEVHLADHSVISNSSPATTGAIVHDQVTLTVTGETTWSGTLTLNFFKTNDCSGTPFASEQFSWDQSDPSTRDNRLPQGPLADGGYSYQASFDSSNDALDKTGDCEPFKVGSSITSFWYNWRATCTSVPADVVPLPTPPCTATGDSHNYTGTSLNNNGDYANVGKSVNAGGKNKALDKYQLFSIHVDVTNNSGVTKDVKVQGGLAAQSTWFDWATGAKISSFPYYFPKPAAVTCGSARLDLSSSNNVVTWIINDMPSGSTSTCILWIYELKGYTSTGLQAVTSSWSQVDCPAGTVSNEQFTQGNLSALGETKPGCVKSKYTGNLLVNVT